MKQTNRIKRLLSLALTAAVLLGVVLPVNGTEPELQALRFQRLTADRFLQNCGRTLQPKFRTSRNTRTPIWCVFLLFWTKNPPLTRVFHNGHCRKRVSHVLSRRFAQ